MAHYNFDEILKNFEKTKGIKVMDEAVLKVCKTVFSVLNSCPSKEIAQIEGERLIRIFEAERGKS